MFCINPDCSQPNSPGDDANCIHCGTTLLINERYRLLHPLSPIRSFAPTQVFEVEDILDPLPKVMKVLVRPISLYVTLMQREDNALGLLDAPGRIPRVGLDAYFTVQTSAQLVLHCLVEQKIEGQNLLQWLEGGGVLSESQAIEWLRQLAEILKVVHDNRFFHRDIKPANIMLRPEGQLALIDFGAVRQVSDTYILRLRSTSSSSTIYNLTNITAVGTFGYTPPEQQEGKAVPESDFYALGRTFVHLLTRQFPNRLPSDPSTGIQWRDRAPQISSPFADFLDLLMAPDWHKRPSTPEKVLELLEGLPRKIKRDRFRHSWQFKSLSTITGITVAALALWELNTQSNALYKRAVQATIEQAKDLQAQGTQLQLQNKYLDAREKYEQALRLQPDSVQVRADLHNNLAVLCQTQEKFKCAIENYQNALKLLPDRPQTVYNLASLYDDAGDLAKAKLYYAQVLQFNAELTVETKNNLARVENMQGRYGEAVKLSTEALTQNTNPVAQAPLLKNLGWGQFKLGQYGRALETLEKARSIEQRADVYCLLAQVKQSQQQEANADKKLCLQQNDSTAKLPEVQEWRKQLINQLIR